MKMNPGQVTTRTVTPRQIWASDVGMQFINGGGRINATYAYDGKNTTGQERELREGTPMARITATKLWCPCKRSKTSAVGRASQALVVTDSRAFQTGDSVTVGGNQSHDILKVRDLDAAAATGLAVYLHLDELSESPFGHFESVTAGNADAYVETLGGGKIKIEDDDAAATGGVAVYFDEDAASPEDRFLATTPTGKDAFVLDSNGRAIRIKYHAAPGTPGVLIYFDDDADTISERLLFVSPTNVDGFLHTDDSVSTNVDKPTRTTGNVITAINYGTNTLTLTTAATWATGDAVYCDNLAGSEICRAVLDEYVDLIDRDSMLATNRPVGRLAVGGTLRTSQILGDITAILASTHYLDFKFDSDIGQD